MVMVDMIMGPEFIIMPPPVHTNPWGYDSTVHVDEESEQLKFQHAMLFRTYVFPLARKKILSKVGGSKGIKFRLLEVSSLRRMRQSRRRKYHLRHLASPAQALW